MTARQTYYAESTGQSTATGVGSDSFSDKVTLTFTPDASSDYFIFGCALINNDAGTTDVLAKLLNSTSATTFNSVNVEEKDITDYFSFFGCAKDSFGASPASQTYKLQWANESTGTTTAIKEARILALKAGANDQYQEALAETTTTSSSFQDKVTLTFTPGSLGDYTFIFAADMTTSSTGTSFGCQLDIDGTGYVAATRYIDDATTYLSIMGVVPGISLTAASHTIKLQFKSDGTRTTKIRNAKIIALRQSDFEVAQTVRQGTRQTRTASTYADVSGATLTFTPEAVEHIAFASSIFDHSSTTSSGYNQLLEGATVISEMTEEPTNTAETMHFAVFYRKTLSASSTTWAIQHKAESSGTVGTDEAAIAVFQSGTASGASGTAAPTEAADTASASGLETITGTAAPTETVDTCSASGLAGIRGDAAPVETADTASAAGTETFTGTASPTETADTASASGIEEFTGTATATETADTASADGLAGIRGSAAPIESADTASASGTETITGTTATTEANDTAAADGVAGIRGSAAIAEAADTASASGSSAEAGQMTGTVNTTEAADTATASGLLTISGTASITEQADTAAASALLTFSGSAAIAESADTATATALQTISGAVSSTEAADTATASGIETFTGTAGITEDADTASATGSMSIPAVSGSAAATEAADTVSGAGLVLALTPSMNNVLIVPAESRRTTIPVQSRRVSVPSQHRTVTIPAETRRITIASETRITQVAA